jgi:hypothetical protein
MRTHRIVRSLVLAAGLACAGAAQAQTLFGTGITYQGQLKDGAQAANGTYQFVFSLYDAASGGNFVDRVGSTSGPITIPVVNGLFTQELGFPQAAAFNGADRWLEIQVRPQGGTGYTTLGPRQKMTAAPYALQTRGLLSITGGNAVMTRIGPGTPLSMYTGIEFANGANAAWSMVRVPDNSLHVTAGPAGTGLKALIVTPQGNIGIGGSMPTAPLQVFGRAKVNVLEITGGSDIAEPFDVAPAEAADEVTPGMIVSIDPAHVGKMRVSTEAYDRAVAGVISGAGEVGTGLVLHQEGMAAADGSHPIALSGRVWVLVDADAGGAVRPGDLITTSATAGHGMRASDEARRGGAVIGKAMSTLESGKGLVLVLVNLQ